MSWTIKQRGMLGFGGGMAALVLFVGSASQAQVVPAATTGSVVGTVTDSQGKLVRQAQVTLTPDAGADGVPAMPLVLKTDADGGFKFTEIPAGHFLIAVTAEGFQATTTEGKLLAGQYDELPAIVLGVGGTTTDVEVHPLTQVELAQQDIKAEEHQRVLGVFPNFYVVFKDNPPPLNARQKMDLSLHAMVDPFNFVTTAAVAGLEQANDTLPGYGSGPGAYGKRYGASYANFASATVLRHGVYPAIFHQDPRYYYRGTGSKMSRTLYALSTAVICKGDNGHNQFNYSGILGDLSAGALTNLYFPEGSKNGLSTTFENAGLSTLGVGVGHVMQEFLFSRLTNKKSAVGGK